MSEKALLNDEKQMPGSIQMGFRSVRASDHVWEVSDSKLKRKNQAFQR